MNTMLPLTLEDAIRQSGEGSLIDWYAPASEAMTHISQTLEAINQLAMKRLGGNAPNLTEDALLNEYVKNPHRVRAFFQALGETHP